jgi:hypothetical protein
LYLPNYAYGHLIEFQLERYFEGKTFSKEVDRVYSLGYLTPDAWMNKAVGESLSAEPIILEAKKSIGLLTKSLEVKGESKKRSADAMAS